MSTTTRGIFAYTSSSGLGGNSCDANFAQCGACFKLLTITRSASSMEISATNNVPGCNCEYFTGQLRSNIFRDNRPSQLTTIGTFTSATHFQLDTMEPFCERHFDLQSGESAAEAYFLSNFASTNGVCVGLFIGVLGLLLVGI